MKGGPFSAGDGRPDFNSVFTVRFENEPRLQEDLDNLAAWSNNWQMLFRVEKCKVMHMGYNNTCYEYFLDGSKLESVSEEKSLGVYISDDLKWKNNAVKLKLKLTK